MCFLVSLWFICPGNSQLHRCQLCPRPATGLGSITELLNESTAAARVYTIARHPVVGLSLQLLLMPRASEVLHRWMYFRSSSTRCARSILALAVQGSDGRLRRLLLASKDRPKCASFTVARVRATVSLHEITMAQR